MPKKNEISVVDRFEGEWAVIEWKDKNFNFPRELLPEEVNEGDILIFNVEVDKKETERRKKSIEDLARDLFKNE